MEEPNEVQHLNGPPETNGFQRLLSPRHKNRRLIHKTGKSNVLQKPGSPRLAFSQLADSSWLFIVTAFPATLMSLALLFATVWWLICHTHGDFEPNHLPPLQEKNNFTPCVYHIYDFWSCLFYSIETQHTVGYGIRATTIECPEAIFLNALQGIIGFIIQSTMAAIIFSKISLPRLRSQTLLFSKSAVICPRNKSLCLMFRMGDMRKNHIVDARVRVLYVRSERTVEGEVLEHHQVELPVTADGGKGGIFFNWPVVVFHRIGRESPLYHLEAKDLNQNGFEVVVVVEGMRQSTGQMTQARTSYLASEIAWGWEFRGLISFNKERREFEADFSKFDEVLPVWAPRCSAAEYGRTSNRRS